MSTWHSLFVDGFELLLAVSLCSTSYVMPLSVPASHGMRSVTSLWTQPQSLVQRSSPDSPTFQSGLGPNMVKKDMRWRVRSTENSADGAARLERIDKDVLQIDLYLIRNTITAQHSYQTKSLMSSTITATL